MKIEEAIEIIEYARAFNEGNTPLMVALDTVIDAVRSMPKSRRYHFSDLTKMISMSEAGEPLSLEQLKEMDGKAVKIVIDDVEPLEMLALVKYVKEAGCVILTNNLGGRSEYYDDDEMHENGVKAYSYPPAHIDRSKWKPCEWCGSIGKKPDNWVCSLEDDNGYTITNNHMVVCATANYCPVCGRPLTEEAWAELERRVCDDV